MKLPVNFEQFSKNPVAAIAFMLCLGVGYLYMDQKSIHKDQLITERESCTRIEQSLNDRITSLEERNAKYEEKLEQINIKLLECLQESTN